MQVQKLNVEEIVVSIIQARTTDKDRDRTRVSYSGSFY